MELDSGGEVTSFPGWWTYLDGIISPTGNLDESGVRLRLEGAGGQYSYPKWTPSLRIYDSEVQGDALAGYEWVFTNLAVMGLLGGDIQNHQLSAPDPDNTVQGTRAGVKTVLEITANPTSNTLLAGYGSYSSAFDTYDVDLRPGFGVARNVFVGPQVMFVGDDQYSQWRVGAHVTGVKLGPLETFVAGGYVHDSLQGGGAYGMLEVSTHF